MIEAILRFLIKLLIKKFNILFFNLQIFIYITKLNTFNESHAITIVLWSFMIKRCLKGICRFVTNLRQSLSMLSGSELLHFFINHAIRNRNLPIHAPLFL